MEFNLNSGITKPSAIWFYPAMVKAERNLPNFVMFLTTLP